MDRFKFGTILLLLCPSLSFSQKIVSGPFQGATNPGEMKVWMLVQGAGEVQLTLMHKNSDYKISQTVSTQKGTYKKYYPVTFDFKGIEKTGRYQWMFGAAQDTLVGTNEFNIATNEVVDFSFLVGSCAVRIPKPFTLIHPGIEDKIFDAMVQKESEFMLWLGDYLYYKSKQMADSYKSMEIQYIMQRKMKRLDVFMKGQPQYAIWDDHDYGNNDSDRNFKYKDLSLEVFTNYWPNPAFGLEDTPGVFYSFVKHDAEFFMTDDRYHRSAVDAPDKTYLGQAQKAWLKEQLKASTATFKFIATGNQVLSPVNKGESYQDFPEELRELMDFIKKEQISGVIFLSGDRHHTELMKFETDVDYPIYEFTNSALTSIGIPPKSSTEKTNPIRIDGTMVFDNNFGRISIQGPVGDRRCTMETYSNRGELLWDYTISEKEISNPK